MSLDKLISECEFKAAAATQGEITIKNTGGATVIRIGCHSTGWIPKEDAVHIEQAVNSQAKLIAALKVAQEALNEAHLITCNDEVNDRCFICHATQKMDEVCK